MKSENIKKSDRIKVQKLRNNEMRAAQGGTEYTCGSGSGDDCKKLIVHVEALASDLLSIYK
ncbi:MAG: hypothetical protein GTO45_07600 [Candidatus Aminicenantes bacterium]|nr:hypothetical protein [Candidatus Aminicenantes bacterium]NIM78700.1 hypothetical protein [Candidatus Aminicenantes bacterium]NIN17948.1 hypothetical protein [Candidatus Aminicenantes bacterium]NIN41851.1 hypothetical protein [Candidatus Aminicenantes bacterium]NIN84603.1 hypothetical protein [Candidatus Aminicenantes bacterium]